MSERTKQRLRRNSTYGKEPTEKQVVEALNRSGLVVPPIYVAVKSPTQDGGTYGDEAIRLHMIPPGARDTVSRYEVADKLRELAAVVAGTISTEELAGADIVLLFRKKR
jgi:hypothetical protein